MQDITLTNDDHQLLLNLSKKKRIKLQDNSTIHHVITRLGLIDSYNQLSETVRNHSMYEDSKGNSGTSPAGFMLQINRRIKAAIGKPVPNLNGLDEMEVARLMRSVADVKIKQGESARALRSDIKSEVYSAIEKIQEVFSSNYEKSGLSKIS